MTISYSHCIKSANSSNQIRMHIQGMQGMQGTQGIQGIKGIPNFPAVCSTSLQPVNTQLEPLSLISLISRKSAPSNEDDEWVIYRRLESSSNPILKIIRPLSGLQFRTSSMLLICFEGDPAKVILWRQSTEDSKTTSRRWCLLKAIFWRRFCDADLLKTIFWKWFTDAYRNTGCSISWWRQLINIHFVLWMVLWIVRLSEEVFQLHSSYRFT